MRGGRLAIVFGISLGLAGCACSTPARRRSNAVQAGTFDLLVEHEGTACRGVLVLSDAFLSPRELPRIGGLPIVDTTPSASFNACLVITEPAGTRCALDLVGALRLFRWSVHEGEAYATYAYQSVMDEYGRVAHHGSVVGFLSQRANGDIEGDIHVGSPESHLVGTVAGKRRGPADFAACTGAPQR